MNNVEKSINFCNLYWDQVSNDISCYSQISQKSLELCEAVNEKDSNQENLQACFEEVDPVYNKQYFCDTKYSSSFDEITSCYDLFSIDDLRQKCELTYLTTPIEKYTGCLNNHNLFGSDFCYYEFYQPE